MHQQQELQVECKIPVQQRQKNSYTPTVFRKIKQYHQSLTAFGPSTTLQHTERRH
jgi:hypothetical protein